MTNKQAYPIERPSSGNGNADDNFLVTSESRILVVLEHMDARLVASAEGQTMLFNQQETIIERLGDVDENLQKQISELAADVRIIKNQTKSLDQRVTRLERYSFP